MNLNKVLKGLLVAVPVLTLAACSSNNETDAGDANANANQPVVADQGLSDAEQLRQQLEALRQQNTIYFDFDKSDIRSEFASVLDAHAAFLRARTTISVTIEGHTDARGTPEYNIALGERRGQSVQKYLENLGVAAGQMSVVSYGEEKPVDAGNTEEAFAKNRRAVLVY
ncbi:MAG: peptidoglycan-associated lipoprotein Pal [Rheinheimera sp.]|jgi:peptidoglycan-associated lipoprotein|uniref:peptidoglycan-associated lipoprotein Pal n=1 Tax=Rheinheimera texasensis TaxID=306205 RepID=UPI0004E19F94|nr:peptidoglycan-associated lipoprotein Pal [Rheinheimera texasensis]TXH94171.1 MAG: peptidoglycan-associated lipoprotein Pal [Rheinheimera sp.]